MIFSTIFLLKRFFLGPIRKRFLDLFSFREDIRSQIRKSRVRIVNDYVFFCKYLRENEKFRETVFACSNGAQVKIF